MPVPIGAHSRVFIDQYEIQTFLNNVEVSMSGPVHDATGLGLSGFRGSRGLPQDTLTMSGFYYDAEGEIGKILDAIRRSDDPRIVSVYPSTPPTTLNSNIVNTGFELSDGWVAEAALMTEYVITSAVGSLVNFRASFEARRFVRAAPLAYRPFDNPTAVWSGTTRYSPRFDSNDLGSSDLGRRMFYHVLAEDGDASMSSTFTLMDSAAGSTFTSTPASEREHSVTGGNGGSAVKAVTSDLERYIVLSVLRSSGGTGWKFAFVAGLETD